MSSRSGRDWTCASKPWLLVRWSAVLQFNVVLEVLEADRGQRRWDLAGGEPADLGAFLRLANYRLARPNATARAHSSPSGRGGRGQNTRNVAPEPRAAGKPW